MSLLSMSPRHNGHQQSVVGVPAFLLSREVAAQSVLKIERNRLRLHLELVRASEGLESRARGGQVRTSLEVRTSAREVRTSSCVRTSGGWALLGHSSQETE